MLINSNKIRILMAERKYTVKALAELIGMDKGNISRVLVRGSCHPITASRIADGLGVPVSQIVREDT